MTYTQLLLATYLFITLFFATVLYRKPWRKDPDVGLNNRAAWLMIEILCSLLLIVFGALPLIVMLSTSLVNHPGPEASAPSSAYALPIILVAGVGCITAIYSWHLRRHNTRNEPR